MKGYTMGYARAWVLLGVMCFCSSTVLASTKLSIAPKKSKVQWVGKKVTGSHQGTVGIKTGYVEFEGAELIAAEIQIDMNTLECSDIKNPKWNKKLIKHLKNDDFFSVHKFPTATFVLSASTKKTGSYRLEGQLTMKGQTHPIAFDMKIRKEGRSYKADGTVLVDRTLWGIQYKSGKFFPDLGDKIIYDIFELHLSLVTQ